MGVIMPWDGPPRWSGEKVVPSQVVGNYYAETPLLGPLIILIEGSEDPFFMVFSTEEKLRATVDRMKNKIGFPTYFIEQVPNKGFLDIFIQNKIRIMYDPVVIDDHHTKWTEIVKENEIYKYVNPEIN